MQLKRKAVASLALLAALACGPPVDGTSIGSRRHSGTSIIPAGGCAPSTSTGVHGPCGVPKGLAFRRTTNGAIIGDSVVAQGSYDGYFTLAIAHFPGSPAPTWLNAGVSGNRAADVDARIVADVVNQIPKPNFVLVAIGVNDASGNTNSGPFTTSYNSLLAKLIAGGIPANDIGCVNVIGLGDGVPPGSLPVPYDTYAINTARINGLIATACAAVGAQMIDIRSQFITYEQLHNPANAVNGTAPFVVLNGSPHPVDPVGHNFCRDVLLANIPFYP